MRLPEPGRAHDTFQSLRPRHPECGRARCPAPSPTSHAGPRAVHHVPRRALYHGRPGAEGLASRLLLPDVFASGKQTGLLEGGGGGNANSFIHYSLVYK